MKLGIMQPYFLPYIGYYQLIHAVDVFVVYDNIKYTKKGWINRNRFLLNGAYSGFSLPIKAGSDSLLICERQISDDFNPKRLLDQFRGAYFGAPYSKPTLELLEKILLNEEKNLFNFLYSTISEVCMYLSIKTTLRKSSDIQINHQLKGRHKVIAICQNLGAHTYINSPGGRALYDGSDFLLEGIELRFLEPRMIRYSQFGDEFLPWLSIIDILMFNSHDFVMKIIEENYSLE